MKTLVGALGQSLDDALARGVARDPSQVPGGRRWLLLSALAAIGVGVALWHTDGYHTGFATLNAAFSALPGWVWQWLTVLGDERVAFAIALLFARRHPRVFWALICAALVAVLYARGLKTLLALPRPPAVLAPGSFEVIGPAHRGASFPSGHSTTAAVFFGVLIYYARGLGWRAVFVLLAILVGLSRVAVGVHWPIDVAAGLAGGALAALAGVWLARRSTWGFEDVGVHLAFVTLGAIVTVGLLVDDGGYPAAALPLRLLAVAALALTAWGWLRVLVLGLRQRFGTLG